MPKQKIETKLFNGDSLAQKVGKKLKEFCTVDGRAEKIMADQYSKVLEQLPPETSVQERAQMEQMLRERSRSVATGALVTDALLTGAVVVTGGLVGRQVLKEAGDYSKYVKYKNQVLEKIMNPRTRNDKAVKMGKRLRAMKNQAFANPMTRTVAAADKYVLRPSIGVTKWGAEAAWNVVTFPFWGTYKVMELFGIPQTAKEIGTMIKNW